MQWTKLSISVVIVLIIGLHVLPALQKHQGDGQTFWPIMAWGMYRKSRDANRPISTVDRRIVGITAGGEKVQIGPRQVGLSSYALNRIYLGPMIGQNDVSATRQLANRLNRKRSDPVIAFQVESTTYTISDAGISKEENPVVVYQVPN